MKNLSTDPQVGLTLLEVLFSFTLLSAGTALFYALMHQRIKQQGRLQNYELALEAARSDLESLHGLPRNRVHDSSYSVVFNEVAKIRIQRVVMDSAKIVSLPTTLSLNATASPQALAEPLEVQVKVYSMAHHTDDFLGNSFLTSGIDSTRDTDELLRLTTRLPEYQWH